MKKILSVLVILFVAGFSFAQTGADEEVVVIKSYSSFDKVYPGGQFKLAVKVNINGKWHINSNKPNDDFLIPSELSIDTTGAFRLAKVNYPAPQEVKLSFSDKPLSVYEKEVYMGGLVKISENVKPGKYKLIVTLDYQSCNNNTCLAPTSVQDTLDVEVVNKETPATEINQDIFKNIDLSYTATGVGAVQSSGGNDDVISSTLEKSGIFLGLILVFVWGLALNLTPCVYPLIPITIGYFGGQSEGSTAKLVGMGLLYMLGMAITYSAVGVITALSGSIFGALLQNPIVIVVISLVFIALSLSMFGLYELKMPDKLVMSAGGAKGGMFGAFFMGLTMGIVAAPCIGPVVLGLVTYVAAKGDPYFGFLMFFVLAVGLGFPYLILAIFSGKIKSLPRAGEWMEAVKHIFGFMLIGMALYFLNPILPKSFSGYILPVFMIIAAAYLLFVDKLANSVKGFRIFKIVFSIIIVAVAVYALIPSQKASISWKKYSEAGLPKDFANSKGMIIDFYADWCIPCKELDAATFSNAKVINASKDFYAYKADMTKSLSPEVETLRNKYKILGVPTVLIINSKGEEVQRITGFVDAEKFYSYLADVN